MSSGGRIAMGEEGGEGHFSWYCCQKACSLNDSPVACPAKSHGNPQCHRQNPAFQPNVLCSDLFIYLPSALGSFLAQRNAVVRDGVVGAERERVWCWMVDTPNQGQAAVKKVLVRTWSPL